MRSFSLKVWLWDQRRQIIGFVLRCVTLFMPKDPLLGNWRSQTTLIYSSICAYLVKLTPNFSLILGVKPDEPPGDPAARVFALHKPPWETYSPADSRDFPPQWQKQVGPLLAGQTFCHLWALWQWSSLVNIVLMTRKSSCVKYFSYRYFNS